MNKPIDEMWLRGGVKPGARVSNERLGIRVYRVCKGLNLKTIKGAITFLEKCDPILRIEGVQVKTVLEELYIARSMH